MADPSSVLTGKSTYSGSVTPSPRLEAAIKSGKSDEEIREQHPGISDTTIEKARNYVSSKEPAQPVSESKIVVIEPVGKDITPEQKEAQTRAYIYSDGNFQEVHPEIEKGIIEVKGKIEAQGYSIADYNYNVLVKSDVAEITATPKVNVISQPQVSQVQKSDQQVIRSPIINPLTPYNQSTYIGQSPTKGLVVTNQSTMTQKVPQPIYTPPTSKIIESTKPVTSEEVISSIESGKSEAEKRYEGELRVAELAKEPGVALSSAFQNAPEYVGTALGSIIIKKDLNEVKKDMNEITKNYVRRLEYDIQEARSQGLSEQNIAAGQFVKGVAETGSWEAQYMGAAVAFSVMPAVVSTGTVVGLEGYSIKKAVEEPTPINIGRAVELPIIIAAFGGAKAIKNIKKPSFLTATKGKGESISLPKTDIKQDTIKLGKIKSESTTFKKEGFIIKKTTPESKTFIDTGFIKSGKRSGSVSLVTDVSKTGQIKSGVAVSREINVLENVPIKTTAGAAKTKFITLEKSYPSELVVLSKNYAEIIRPGELVSRDTLLRQSGILTTKKIAVVASSGKGKGSAGDYLLADFKPITKPKIDTYFSSVPKGTPSSADLGKVAMVESTVKAVAQNTPTIVKAEPGAYFSAVGTIIPKSDSPVLTIEEQKERKATGNEEDIWAKEYTPIVSPTTKINTMTKLETKLSLPEEKVVTQGKTLAKDVARSEKVGNKEAIGFVVGIGETMGQKSKEGLKTRVGQRTARITQITQQIATPVQEIPESFKTIKFPPPSLGYRGDDKRKYGRYLLGEKYSLKTHPYLTAKEAMKKEFKPMKPIKSMKIKELKL